MVRPADHTLPYSVYAVMRKHREPLLRFVHDALASSGCHVINSSDAGYAPFRITFETAAGERIGIIVYAFFANQRLTRNRPGDDVNVAVHVFDSVIDKYYRELLGAAEARPARHLRQ